MCTCCCKQDKENRHKNLKERDDQAVFDRAVKELKLSDEQVAKLRAQCDEMYEKLFGDCMAACDKAIGRKK